MQDLLQPRAVELTLRESPEGAIEVPGLREVEVCSLEDCLGLLQLGDRNRFELLSARRDVHAGCCTARLLNDGLGCCLQGNCLAH